jgi:hypothetical protein
MESPLTLTDMIREALATGAVGFTLRSGLQPIVHSEKGAPTHHSQTSTFDDIEATLRQLASSREMRQFRKTGVAYFRSSFEGRVLLVGGAKIEGEVICVELRKMAAQPGAAREPGPAFSDRCV